MTSQKKSYDPHILYLALNIEAELKHMLDARRIYKILETMPRSVVNTSTAEEMAGLFRLLGKTIAESADCNNDMDDAEEIGGEEKRTLRQRIREILSLTGCELSTDELNQILSGKVSPEKAMSKKSVTAWNCIFTKTEQGRYIPDSRAVESMRLAMTTVAIRLLEEKQLELIRNAGSEKFVEYGYKSPIRSFREPQKDSILQKEESPAELERKANKLRLYIAHMQGYDRDLDGDGGRGIDPQTGIVIDYSDIYIADKSHGAIIEDKDRDNVIDIEDIC